MDFANSDQILIAGYVILAMILGAALGIEREYADKPAGLRPHILVAGAAALFVALNDIAVTKFATVFHGLLVSIVDKRQQLKQ